VERPGRDARQRGRSDEALRELEALPARVDALLGPGHVHAASAAANAASMLLDRRRHAEARPLLERAAETFRREFGADHPNTLIVEGNLVSAMSRAGDPARAADLAAGLVPRVEAAYGPRSYEAVNARHRVAATLLLAERPAEAVAAADGAATLALATLGEAHWFAGQCLATRGYAHAAAGDAAAGRADLTRARAILSAALGEGHDRVTSLDARLAQLRPADAAPTTAPGEQVNSGP